MQHLIIITDTDIASVFVNTTLERAEIAHRLDRSPLTFNKRWDIYEFTPAPLQTPNDFAAVTLQRVDSISSRSAFEQHLQKAIYYANIHGTTSTQIEDAISTLHRALDLVRRREEIYQK